MEGLERIERIREGALPTPEYAGPLPLITDRDEVFALASSDPLFYDHYFFPRAFRQPDPPYGRELCGWLEHPDHRYIAVQIFRGGSKTTRLRSLVSKRIAFATSRTILYVGKSDDHANNSVMWINKAIRFNNRWSETFGLSKGTRFNQGVLEIHHNIAGHDIYITGAGITGSLRGINFDDYRPDLIILDDIIDRESVHTARARKKVTDLVHGDIKESLEAATDNPHAKLVLLETPLDANDPGEQAKTDPLWTFYRISCWTRETEELMLESQVSSWPDRYPSEMLRKEKKAAIETNRLYLFVREKECKLISPETSSFREEWLQYYDVEPPRHEMHVVMRIDPVPPPSPQQILDGLAKKDYECFAVVGAWQGNFYLLEYRLNRGHEPDWSVKSFFELAQRWRPRHIGVESTAYQRTLAALFRMAMRLRRQYFTVDEIDDKRAKHDKVVDGLHGPASERKLFIRKGHHEFKDQFGRHPDIEHDDLIETVAGCVEDLNMGVQYENYEDIIKEEEQEFLPLRREDESDWRACP